MGPEPIMVSKIIKQGVDFIMFYIVYLLSPLIVGYTYDKLITMGMSVSWYFPISLTFLVFWIWVGSRYVILPIKKLYSYLLGNSLSFAGLFIHLISYHVNWPRGIYRFSSLYPFPLYRIVGHVTGRISAIFDYPINISDKIFAYLLLILCFSIGFYYQYMRVKRCSTDR